MKRAACSVLAFALALPLLAAPVRAEDRVIDEELVLQDPTVAASKKWVAGASGEYWYIAGPYRTSNAAGKTVSNGSINGSIPGVNVFVGYDKVTLQYSHREGTLDVDLNDVDRPTIKTHSAQKQIEDEVTLRWLVKANKHFSPYLLVGYNETSMTAKTEINAASGFVYTYNGTRFLGERTTYTSGLVGLGAILPVNEKLGFRADGRLLFTSAVYNRDDNRNRLSGSGVGGAMTGTVYLNIISGLNAQAGLKGQVLNGGSTVGAYGRFGMFASLGYSQKF
jgi:hypothetical protein